jgi:hypothetical protein
MPEDAIVHPLARLGGYIKPAYLCASSRFTIGDYDRADMEFVRATNPEKEFRLGPVGCPPALERDGKPETRDIDVLIHGIAGLARLAAVYDPRAPDWSPRSSAAHKTRPSRAPSSPST